MSFKISVPLLASQASFNQLNTQVQSIAQATQITPESTANKGINIDDTTVALTPQSNNPPQTSDTFPYSWMGVAPSKIQNIRTFHYDTNGASWVAWAVQHNIQVIVGITLSNYTAELNQFQTDYQAADANLQALYNTNVIAIAVGNEETSVSTIQAGIAYARTLTLPTSALYTSILDATNTWLANTYPPQSCTFTSNFITLSSSLDVVCFNCYGGYFTYGANPYITVENSVSWASTAAGGSVLLNQFAAISFAMQAASITTEFWVTETGWCSSSEISNNQNWSNVTNEQTFYQNFIGFSLTTPYTAQAASTTVMPPNKIFYFSVRDVPGGEGGAGFGLYTSAASLTPKWT